MHKALFSEFAYPAFESFHEIKVVEVTRRQKSVACGQTLIIIIIIIIIIITNFYTGLKNPSVCNTVVLGVLSKIINK